MSYIKKKMTSKIGIINNCDYTNVVKKLREFFDSKGFHEVHTQSRLSILAHAKILVLFQHIIMQVNIYFYHKQVKCG